MHSSTKRAGAGRPLVVAPVCSAKKRAAPGGSASRGRPNLSEGMGIRVTRAALLGSLPIGLAAAIEVVARPSVPDISAFDPNDVSVAAEAKEKFTVAEALRREGKNEDAAVAYTEVIKLAPRDYTLCMKSLLGRRDAYLALGKRDLVGEDNRREWLWGRGIRWPGWYIISAIIIRNEFYG